jgi:hypothetical protein
MKTKITVEAKKGTTQETTWKITQGHPYPDIDRSSWRNGEGLFPEWQGSMSGGAMVAQGMPTRYHVALLRSDLTTEANDRTDYAGFTHGKYGEPQTTNPGTITYRGKDLGEMTFTIEASNPYINMRDRTPSEREFIEAQIIPGLKAAIEANKHALRQEALNELETQLAERIATMRADADKLEKEAWEAFKVEKARKV